MPRILLVHAPHHGELADEGREVPVLDPVVSKPSAGESDLERSASLVQVVPSPADVTDQPIEVVLDPRSIVLGERERDLGQKKGAGVATEDELVVLGVQMRLMYGFTENGLRNPGLKDIKKGLDSSAITLEQAKKLRDTVFLPIWRAAEERLAERNK